MITPEMSTATDALKQWKRISLMPLERFETLEVLMRDGSSCKAVWTGAKWLSNGKPVSPVGWRVPSSVDSVAEETKLKAHEILNRLPEKPAGHELQLHKKTVKRELTWFKRPGFSVRRLWA
jgi:hypothetical protein